MQAEGNIRDRSPSAATQTQRGIASGLLLGFLSAGIFGFVTPLARFSYEFGVNPATAALFRLGLSALATSLLVLALRRRIRLPRAGILPVLGMTISLSATVLCSELLTWSGNKLSPFLFRRETPRRNNSFEGWFRGTQCLSC